MNLETIVPNLRFSGNPGFTSNTFDTVGDFIGMMFRLDEDATITTVGVRQSTRVNSVYSSTPPPQPNAFIGTVRIGIRTIDNTNGLPSTTWVGGSSNYVDVSSWTAANDNTFVTVTLPSNASLSRGVPYCVYAEYVTAPSGTFSTVGSVSLSNQFSSSVLNSSYPYTVTETTVGTNKTAGAGFGPWLIRSSTKTYGNPIASFETASIRQDTTPDEIGLGFTMPSGFGSNYKISQALLQIATVGNTSGGTFDIVLYEGTTALQTTTIDINEVAGVGSTRRYDLPFDVTLSSLTPGTEYIIAVKPNSTVSNENVVVREIALPVSDDKSAYGNYSLKYYSRTNGGSWSETTTRLPCFGFVIDSVTTSGGSTAANPLAGYIL